MTSVLPPWPLVYSSACHYPSHTRILPATPAGEELPAIEARIRVRLTPRAARDEIAGWQGDVLRVRVSAPPVEGRANAALERLLASALGVPQSAVRVVSGAHSREKLAAVDGLEQADALHRLGAATLP